MPPRRVDLAYAGRKLVGPPEGYDKKKELLVKRWLSSTPQGGEDMEVAASVAASSEVRACVRALQCIAAAHSAGLLHGCGGARAPGAEACTGPAKHWRH